MKPTVMMLWQAALWAALASRAPAQRLPLSLVVEEDASATATEEPLSTTQVLQHVREAEELWRSGEPEDALVPLDELLHRSPHQKQALLARGRILCELERYEEAERDLLACLVEEPEDSAVEITCAFLYQRWQKWDEARRHLRSFVEKEPEAAHAWNALGLLELRCGRLNAATLCFEESSRQHPDWLTPRMNRAAVDLQSRRYVEAEAALRELFDADPTLTEAMLLHSEALMGLQEEDSAVEELRGLSSLSDAAQSEVRLTALCRLGAYFHQHGELREALSCYERVILDSEQLRHPVLDDVARIQFELGRTEQAADLMNLAVLMEDRASDRVALAGFLAASERAELGLQSLRIAYDRGARDPLLLGLLCRLEEEQGDAAKAVSHFAELVDVAEHHAEWKAQALYLLVVCERLLDSQCREIHSDARGNEFASCLATWQCSATAAEVETLTHLASECGIDARTASHVLSTCAHSFSSSTADE